MVNARSGFQKLARKCRREYDTNQTEKLRKANWDNAIDYCKLLKDQTKPPKHIKYQIRNSYD